MIVLRCTQKLLKLSKVSPQTVLPVSIAPLGEWYANAISLTYPGKMAVIYTHNPSRLTVITRGRSIKTTKDEFQSRLLDLLDRMGTPENILTRQRAENEPIYVAKTDSRSMLASMNEIAYFIQYSAAQAGSSEQLNISKLENTFSDYIFSSKEVGKGYFVPKDYLQAHVFEPLNGGHAK